MFKCKDTKDFWKKEEKWEKVCKIVGFLLSLHPLTSFIHLNIKTMKQNLRRNCKFSVKKLASVESFSYLCRWVRDANGQKPQQHSWINSWRHWNRCQWRTTVSPLRLASFCLGIAKLVFGGVILAGIMQQGIEFNSLFLTGLGVVLLFVAFGFYLIKKSKKNRR